ncbi:MAG: heat-inducible transcriptional repressor HrcA [Thermodesulfovibrionales bacterium]
MLNERARKILSAIVQSYIERPDPVGSRYVTKKYALDLSPATIRNIMADLEEMGFLTQPHTSAGRVPTDKGYRFFVDEFCADRECLDENALGALNRKLENIRDDIDTLLRETTRTLSDMSPYLVFAVPLNPERTTLNRIQLYRYMGSQTVAVILTNEGMINNRIIAGDFGLSQRELNRICDYLNSEFSGSSIREIRDEIARQMSKERALRDILISRAAALCGEALSFSGGEIIFSGLSELLGLPDFSDRINDIARAIEDKEMIISILDRIASAPGDVHVVIGSENPSEQWKRLSIVLATYRYGDRPLGSVGMIGPTRMNYAWAIPMVGMAAKYVSDTISKRRELAHGRG